MAQKEWDQRFMGLARHIAGWSKDRGRKVAAVIVGPHNEIRSTGYNGIPRGVADDIEARHSREDGEKYVWCAHAERNAIYSAARIGVSVDGCRLYTTLFPCSDCAIAMIQSGIAELITPPPDHSDPTWGKLFHRAETMLKEAKIKIRFMDAS